MWHGSRELPSKKSKTRKLAKANKALRKVEPVMLPLLDLFSVVDDVMDEPNAFAPETIHKSLGRIYRVWLDTREALDPDFDRAKYRHDMKKRAKSSESGVLDGAKKFRKRTKK